jgi:hypothetical protein
MADRAWVVRQGDALVVHTNYMRCIHKATDSVGATQRGGFFMSAEHTTMDYLRALAATGMVVDFTIPERN